MNLGLGNRDLLKRAILPGSLQGTSSDLVPDAIIDALGRGVATWFGKHCGDRRWERAVADVAEFSGDRLTYVLPRYPVEQITAVSIRATHADPWQPQDLGSVLAGVDLTAGLIQFPALQGNEWSRVRVTYTGGYWFETLEPTELGYPSTMPEGAYPLPADLQQAWLLCCQEIWNKRDKLGLGLSSAPDVHTQIARFELPLGIRQMITWHRRMQLS